MVVCDDYAIALAAYLSFGAYLCLIVPQAVRFRNGYAGAQGRGDHQGCLRHREGGLPPASTSRLHLCLGRRLHNRQAMLRPLAARGDLGGWGPSSCTMTMALQCTTLLSEICLSSLSCCVFNEADLNGRVSRHASGFSSSTGSALQSCLKQVAHRQRRSPKASNKHHRSAGGSSGSLPGSSVESGQIHFPADSPAPALPWARHTKEQPSGPVSPPPPPPNPGPPQLSHEEEPPSPPPPPLLR